MSLSREAIAVGHYDPSIPEVVGWAIRWQYPHPTESSFIAALARTAGLADEHNLALLGRGWPALAEAVRLWRGEPGWSQYAEALCEQRAQEIQPR